MLLVSVVLDGVNSLQLQEQSVLLTVVLPGVGGVVAGAESLLTTDLIGGYATVSGLDVVEEVGIGGDLLAIGLGGYCRGDVHDFANRFGDLPPAQASGDFFRHGVGMGNQVFMCCRFAVSGVETF